MRILRLKNFSFLSAIKELSPTKIFLYLFLCAFLARMAFISLLPESPTSFGPDEGTYSSLADWVAQGLPVSNFPLYGAGLYNTSKTFILPSAGLVLLGIEPITSIRIISLVFGMLSISIVYLILRRIFKNQSLPVLFLTAIYSFWPSNILWSVLGLREVTVHFWLLLAIYLFFQLSKTKKLTKDEMIITLTVLPVLTLTYGVRPETALILSISLVLAIFIASFTKQNAILLLTILLGAFMGQLYVTTPNEDKINNTTNNSSRILNVPQNTFQSKLNQLQNFEYKANVNRIDANSAMPELTCSTSKNLRERLACNLKELPFRMFSVLLRPLPFLEGGSVNSKLASLENIGWFILLLLCLRALFLKGVKFLRDSHWILLTSFAGMYWLGMSMFEGNLGTAFRHKSTLLPILILIIALQSAESRAHTLNQKTWETGLKRKEKKREN